MSRTMSGTMSGTMSRTMSGTQPLSSRPKRRDLALKEPQK
jgi:hypothetical protein